MMTVGRVLIADDDPAIRNLVSKVLDLAGVPHDAVRDGRDAIEHLQRETYDVVLVDLMMPVLNGYELIAWLREHPRRPGTILVMTAADDTALRQLDGTVVTTIVRKPFDIHELSILIRDAALQAAEARNAGGGGENVVPFAR